MGRLKKQSEDGAKSRKVEDGIGKVVRGCGRWMTGSWNVEECRRGWTRLDVA
jgi:hypothetical protein